ncbi:MAG: hypothetical protein ACOC1F_06825, partial [Myxococcota bacterium]
MVVRIDAVASRHVQDDANDSRSLAASCAEACLARGSTNGNALLPLIVYTGVYRDGNVVEPAQAPYTQRYLTEHKRVASDAFSFDIDHLLPGVEIAEGMIRSQGLPCAMVLAVDSGICYAEPKGAEVRPAAAALLLAPSDHGEGFVAFRTDVFPE